MTYDIRRRLYDEPIRIVTPTDADRAAHRRDMERHAADLDRADDLMDAPFALAWKEAAE